MKISKLKKILKDTAVEIIEVDDHIVMYNAEKFEFADYSFRKWMIGSLTTYRFDNELSIKKRFRKSKLFMKNCPDDDKMIILAYEWREKPWLK